MGNMSYNTSNGRYSATYDAENPIGTASALGSWAACSNSNLIIDDSILKESILGSFIVGDIEITRFDIYNVYKGNLAERHVYQSEYMQYKVNGAWQDAPDNYAEDIQWDPAEATTETEFKNLYEPHPFLLKTGTVRAKDKTITTDDYSTELNESYASDMANYKRDLARFKTDRAYYDSGKSKWIYTNTGTTFQGKYSNERIPFKYYFAQGGNFDIQSTTNADKINNNEKAPIVGYSVYSYKSANSPYSYTSGTTMKYNPGKITESNPIKISGGKMDGTVIENTAVYVELTFTVKTFPGFAGLMDIKDAGKQQVTVSRLIDIELNEEYN